MKEWVVAVNHKYGLTPSRLYKVQASTRSVAEDRGIKKAVADYPQFKAFTAVADTLTRWKAKAIKDEAGAARIELCHHIEWAKNWWRLFRGAVNRSINWRAKYGIEDWKRNFARREICYMKNYRAHKTRLQSLEAYWWQLLELLDVING